MVHTATLGYPRFGAARQLKRVLEQFWSGKSTPDDLLKTGQDLRLTHWQLQQAAGIDVIPSNDFSFYDHVLDTSLMVGAIPERYALTLQDDSVRLETYFAMARGIQRDGVDIPAMEMTKWFDTNYHYIVPEIAPNQAFRLVSTKVVDEFLEAKAAGIHTRPVLLGPVSYLLLSKTVQTTIAINDIGTPVQTVTPLASLSNLLPVYTEILQCLAEAGADWVQLDEPCLVLDLNEAAKQAYIMAYEALASINLKLMLTTYFGALGDNLALAAQLPTAGLHIDLVRAPQQLDSVLAQLPEDKILSVGVINGRNVWRTDLDTALKTVQTAVNTLGKDRVQVAPSCSLLFSPHDLELETALDDELKSWLAFARQKLDELVLLKQAVSGENVEESFATNRSAIESRRTSTRTFNPPVRERQGQITEAMLNRTNVYSIRKQKQAEAIPLPPLPTTTIGSFPQTAEVRSQRLAFNKGSITQDAYEAFLKAEIERTIRIQEEIGLDVLVHGESERTDMVEYFGEQLTGIAFTQHGWVQSYGSRGVRPPVIYGDIARPNPMTVEWSVYAQSLTDKPMKGMLTGPVTILEWSFVRDDQPRSVTCQQLGLALRDEVVDLEQAGIRIIQIDEPALREGLPLRRSEHAAYLEWAIDCFRLAASGVRDETQIHTHMCYAEFNDIIEAIGRMDADVISVEASRSNMELLTAFKDYAYPNDIGPGMYDIHSPRIPSQAEMEALIHKASQVVQTSHLWINPDCGLKTRQWGEVIPALKAMVQSAHAAREQLTQDSQRSK